MGVTGAALRIPVDRVEVGVSCRVVSRYSFFERKTLGIEKMAQCNCDRYVTGNISVMTPDSLVSGFMNNLHEAHDTTVLVVYRRGIQHAQVHSN